MELLFSTFAVVGTVSTGIGFTGRSTNDGDLVQDRVVTALGAYSVQVTCSADCISAVVSFRGR
jgi:hypothetical protein